MEWAFALSSGSVFFVLVVLYIIPGCIIYYMDLIFIRGVALRHPGGWGIEGGFRGEAIPPVFVL